MIDLANIVLASALALISGLIMFWLNNISARMKKMEDSITALQMKMQDAPVGEEKCGLYRRQCIREFEAREAAMDEQVTQIERRLEEGNTEMGRLAVSITALTQELREQREVNRIQRNAMEQTHKVSMQRDLVLVQRVEHALKLQSIEDPALKQWKETLEQAINQDLTKGHMNGN
jgi:hypothetical protein